MSPQPIDEIAFQLILILIRGASKEARNAEAISYAVRPWDSPFEELEQVAVPERFGSPAAIGLLDSNENSV